MMMYTEMLALRPAGFKPSLENGLQFFIGKVEKMKDSTEFMMSAYPWCVIGTTFGGVHWEPLENSILQDFFGIHIDLENLKLTSDHPRKLFSDTSVDLYSPIEWEVIQLFTSALPLYLDECDQINKLYWLHLAKGTLDGLKAGIL